MDTKIEIQKINYDLINQAINIDSKERSMLLGFMQKYVAVRISPNGPEVILDTIGSRDECKSKLQHLAVF